MTQQTPWPGTPLEIIITTRSTHDVTVTLSTPLLGGDFFGGKTYFRSVTVVRESSTLVSGSGNIISLDRW